jgi:hypothetical protein
MYGFLLVVALSLSPPGPSTDVPDVVIHSKDKAISAPVWVPLSKAVDSAGHLRWDILGADAQVNFEQVSRNVPAGNSEALPGAQPRYDLRTSGKLPACVYYGPSFRSFAGEPRETIDQLSRSAVWIARGRIGAITQGFFEGEPFSLLTVHVGRNVAGQAGRTLYVLYPYAQFQAGDVSFCKDDSRFPHIPHTGDDIAVFAPRGTTGAEAPLLIPDRNYVIFESDGRLKFPRELETDGAGIETLDDLENRIARMRLASTGASR